jgi:hypothetical protein
VAFAAASCRAATLTALHVPGTTEVPIEHTTHSFLECSPAPCDGSNNLSLLGA